MNDSSDAISSAFAISAGSRRTLPPFAALRAFEAVGRLGSVRRAAVDLSLHHAVVSRHLNALEAWLGVSLLDRSNKGHVLTPRGARFHARVVVSIADIADAVSEVMRADDAPEHLTIWANGGFATKWLGPRLIEFNAENTSWEIELRPSDHAPDLVGREADIDIRFHGDAYSPEPHGKFLRRIELSRPPILVVGSPAQVADLAGQSAHTLLDARLLHEEHDAQWRAWFAAHGAAAPDLIPGARLWHAHIAIAAAVKGEGLALASHLLVHDELGDGRLAIFSPADAAAPPVLGAYFLSARADRWTTPAIARVRSWLEQRMREAR